MHKEEVRLSFVAPIRDNHLLALLLLANSIRPVTVG